MIAVSVFVLVFSLGYGLLGFTSHSRSLNWSTAIDQAIPFLPGFIVFYLLGDLFAFTVFFVVEKKDDFVRMLVGFLLICAIAYFCFLIFPVRMDRELSYGAQWYSKITSLQHTYDTSYNNFPSLHVAFTAYAWLILYAVRRRLAWFSLPLALGIIASVLFVKQHLLVDVVGGLVLAIVIFLWWRRVISIDVEKNPLKRIKKLLN